MKFRAFNHFSLALSLLMSGLAHGQEAPPKHLLDCLEVAVSKFSLETQEGRTKALSVGLNVGEAFARRAAGMLTKKQVEQALESRKSGKDGSSILYKLLQP